MDDDTTVATNASPSAEDTQADVTTNSASVQSEVTPDATQGNEAAQEPASPEVSATDTVEDKLFAGKYKSAEDLEKAYNELNSKFTSTSQEKAELSKILSEAFASDYPQGGATTQPQGGYEDFDDDVQPQSQPQEDGTKRDLAIMKFMFMHDDANPSDLGEILKTDPIVQNINGYDAKLEYAYLRSQNMSQSKAIAKAKEEAAQKAQSKVIEKQAAQVEPVAKSEPVDETAELRARIAGGDATARIEMLKKFYL